MVSLYTLNSGSSVLVHDNLSYSIAIRYLMLGLNIVVFRPGP